MDQLQSHPLLFYKVHSLFSALRQSSGQNIINTLTAFTFPLFCGTKSLHHRLRLRKSFIGWNWLLYGSAPKSPITLLQSPFTVQCIKTVQWPKHSTLTAFPFPRFFGTKSLHLRRRLRKRFVGLQWVWLLSASALNPPSLIQSPLSVQHIKTVQWPKNSAHSQLFLFFFFVGPSLCITD